jgi:hypothetical protein
LVFFLLALFLLLAAFCFFAAACSAFLPAPGTKTLPVGLLSISRFALISD